MTWNEIEWNEKCPHLGTWVRMMFRGQGETIHKGYAENMVWDAKKIRVLHSFEN
jgi:hypothetical protein